MKRIVVSGGFDPVHVRTFRYVEESKELGDHLTVILNTDRFLKEKKRFYFYEISGEKKNSSRI